MSLQLVNITTINVLDNPCAWSNPFQFEITLKCIQELREDIEWKIIYVGSAESNKYDQELESVLVGPIPTGISKFVFQAPAPDPSKIPEKDLLGVTVVIVTCSFNKKEFIRIGYYVNNTKHENEVLHREILAEQPRVTRFPINWEHQETEVKEKVDELIEIYGPNYNEPYSIE
jgi:histone chaperone ASF1